MMSAPCRPILTRVVILAGMLIAGGPARGQETEPVPTVSPFLVINVAGVDRWQENVRYVFKVIDRADVSEAADGLLSRVNGLQGVDRARPFGVMMLLDGLNPRFIGYVPAANVEQLAKTLSIGPVTAKKVDGKDDRYELVGGRQTLYVRFQHDYGFVADNSDLLDRNYPDPAKLTKSLTAKYDLAVSANFDAIPEATRKIFLSLVKTSIEAQLQQRDNESNADYRIRKASGLGNLELVEAVLEHGRGLTLGWDVSPDKKRALVDLALDVRPESDLSNYLTHVASRPSHFRGLLNERAPLAMSVSWGMDKSRRASFAEVLKAAADAIEPGESNPDLRKATLKLLDQAVATVEAGHLDAFAQMASVEEGKFVIAGGVKLHDADATAGPLSDFLAVLPESALSNVQRDAATHRGVSLHRIVPKSLRREDQVIYGEGSSIYLGAGEKAAWFSFGGSEALSSLKRLIDATTDNATPADAASAPFRLVFNFDAWKNVNTRPDGPQQGRELMQKAFSAGNDSLRIDIRPTDTGARLRFDVDEGFLRWIALAIAQRFDRSQL